jgi:hypothetical protein
VLARGPFGGGALGRLALGALDGFAGLALGLGARDAFLLGGFGVLAGSASAATRPAASNSPRASACCARVVQGAASLAGSLFGHLTGGTLGVGPLGRFTDGLLGGLQRDAMPGLRSPLRERPARPVRAILWAASRSAASRAARSAATRSVAGSARSFASRAAPQRPRGPRLRARRAGTLRARRVRRGALRHSARPVRLPDGRPARRQPARRLP